MNDQAKKTVELRARLKPVEGNLLREIALQEGLTASEVVRQAIREKAQAMGIYHLAGQVVITREMPALLEV